MRAIIIWISLYLLILAGFFISGALSPLLSELSPENSSVPLPLPLTSEVSPAGRDEGLIDSPPVVPDFYYGETPTVFSPQRSVSNTPDEFLVASTEGIIYFMDRYGVMQWELVTGSPFIYSEQAHPDIEYYIDISEDRRLHEYSNNFGHRELNSTIEELVRGTPEIKNFMVTLGSTNTTIYLLDAATGKTVLTLEWPVASTRSGVPMVRDELVPSDIETGKNYMILIRTDYSLSSTNLRRNYSPSSSIGPDGHSWRIMSSHIRAAKIKSALPPNIVDNLLLSSPCQVDIPVLFLSKAGIPIYEDHRLPSASHSHNAENGSKKLLVLDSGPDFRENINSSSSYLEIKHFPQLSNDNISSLGSPNTVLESENGCKLGHYVADEPMSSFQCPQNSIILNDNISGISRNIYIDAGSYSVDNDHATTKLYIEMLTEFIYANSVWFMVPTLLMVLAFWYLKLKVFVKCGEEQLNNLRGSQSVAPKKQKARKSGNTKNGTSGNTYEKFGSSGEENANGDKLCGSSFTNLCNSVGAGDGRWVGKLLVSNSEIGRGSNGTVVLEGVYDGRPVAVKRLLRAYHDVALKEIQNLIASDQHPNIVRLYGVEQDIDFVYISLERCSCTLTDLIQLCSETSLHPAAPGEQTSRYTNDHKVPLYCNKGIKKGLELWTGNGFPSSQLLKLMRDMVSGLSHLHELGIMHRDLKPHNVLISSDRCLGAKLSDMGISKRLLEDMSSLTHHSSGGSGSSGWQAPEQLLQGRQSRAVDLFSLGCILFFCITKGRHPFGNHFERDSNIVNNRMDLFLVDHLPEAVHLLSRLLDHNPKMRPNAEEVLHHPFFWGSEMRLSFYRDISDRVELEDRESESELLKALENVAAEAFGGKWGEKLDAAFISDIGRYRKYRFNCMRDLLRVIRNKLNHFRELPGELQEILGPVPEGFDKYFSSRFPKLLIEVFKVICTYCRDEDSFSKYFSSSLV